MMEIGIYGGTFDPVHIGHAVVGSYVAQFGGVDEVWMLVSPLNPLKDGQRRLFTDCQRLEMARLAMAGCPRGRVSGFEMSLPVPSYTYGTLCALRDSYPEHSFRLVAGADNLRDFRLWRNPGGILREFGLLVYPRPGVVLTPEFISGMEMDYDAPDSIRYLADAPTMSVSSTFIREKLSAGTDLRFLIPDASYAYAKRVLGFRH